VQHNGGERAGNSRLVAVFSTGIWALSGRAPIHSIATNLH
jgi:hypothetical protein